MKTIYSDKVIAPKPATITNCKVINGQIFLSGMTARGVDGRVPIGMYEQSKAVFQKMKDLMDAAGGKMNDLVKINIYVTEIGSLEEFWKARREFFTGDFPCATLVEVKSLAQSEFKVEVDGIGFIGAGE